jgi:hypothetical protein
VSVHPDSTRAGTADLPQLPGLVGALVHAAANGLACRDGGGRRPGALRKLAGLGGRGQRPGRGAHTGRDVLTDAEIDQVDAERVADTVVGHYPGSDYPAVVLGSPHGAAAHLAVALGAPWLPAAFDVAIAIPDGAAGRGAGGWASAASNGWMRGASAAARILSANPQATVRQVDTPAGATGRAATLFVRWRHLPTAYTTFLNTRLRPDAAVLLARDSGTWASGHTAQAINPEFVESLRHWAAGAVGRDHALYRVMFSRPEVLSAAVGDLYRRWLRAGGKTGNRLVVESGRLLDPWQVIRAGLVPYWLSGPSRYALEELQWWLAGSEPFSQIDVLVEPPGAPRDDFAWGELASLTDFTAAAGFAGVRGAVDERGSREYPEGSVPLWRATELLRRQPYDPPVPPRLAVRDAVCLLSEATEVSAMIVH